MREHTEHNCDVVVIGGGPAGSTSATIMAKAGLNVVVLERAKFPRFHVGESLMPAVVRIFERLGVYEEIQKKYTRKGGAKLFYGQKPILTSFKLTTKKCDFADHPASFSVERASFDQLLLENAKDSGAQVLEEHSVMKILGNQDQVNGVVAKDKHGNSKHFYAKQVLDCSGQRALMASKFGLKKKTTLKRMSVYAHYNVDIQDDDMRENGWIALQLVKNAWLWMIPLGANKASIGAVVSVDKYKEVSQEPQKFLEDLWEHQPVMKKNLVRKSLATPVHTVGNMSYTSEKMHGDGWALVGDSGFFIDPCYSSGVYFAMLAAEQVADTLVDAFEKDTLTSTTLAAYEKSMRKHEKNMLAMVESLYLTSNSKFLTWFIPRFSSQFLLRRFNCYLGGDLEHHRKFINFNLGLLKTVAALLP